jgi:transposase-like protein
MSMKARTGRATVKCEVVAQLPRACSDEAAAAEFVERQRWGAEPFCPRCESRRVYKMTDRKTGERSKRFLWNCTICRRQFTVRIGTVLEDSRIQLRHWCYAFWAACASKKGVSALQISRMTGLSYKSALFLMHRIRFALAEDPISPAKLEGIIEADETYLGGKPRYKGPHNKRGLGADKIPVFALVARGGKVRAHVPERVTARTLERVITENVNPRHARLITDEAWGYTKIGRKFAGGHDTVNHSKREYARGDVTTNTVEGFFSLLKRGIYGTFHGVSRHHLHRYVDEFCYRYNTRDISDGARVSMAIRNAEGKRLRYREPA